MVASIMVAEFNGDSRDSPLPLPPLSPFLANSRSSIDGRIAGVKGLASRRDKARRPLSDIINNRQLKYLITAGQCGRREDGSLKNGDDSI